MKNIISLAAVFALFVIFLPVAAIVKVPNDGLGWKTADWDEEHPGGANWAWEFIKLPTAWNITNGSKDVKIGVVDLGFDIKHEDLKDNIDSSISIQSVDEHGTHVTGIIGAKGNNSIGISGVMWDADLKV